MAETRISGIFAGCFGITNLSNLRRLTGDGDGFRNEVIFKLNTKNQEPPAPGMQALSGHSNATLWSRPSQRKQLTRVIPVQHHSPDQLVKLFAPAVRRKDGEERIETLLREVDPRIRKVRVDPGDDGN